MAITLKIGSGQEVPPKATRGARDSLLSSSATWIMLFFEFAAIFGGYVSLISLAMLDCVILINTVMLGCVMLILIVINMLMKSAAYLSTVNDGLVRRFCNGLVVKQFTTSNRSQEIRRSGDIALLAKQRTTRKRSEAELPPIILSTASSLLSKGRTYGFVFALVTLVSLTSEAIQITDNASKYYQEKDTTYDKDAEEVARSTDSRAITTNFLQRASEREVVKFSQVVNENDGELEGTPGKHLQLGHQGQTEPAHQHPVSPWTHFWSQIWGTDNQNQGQRPGADSLVFYNPMANGASERGSLFLQMMRRDVRSSTGGDGWLVGTQPGDIAKELPVLPLSDEEGAKMLKTTRGESAADPASVDYENMFNSLRLDDPSHSGGILHCEQKNSDAGEDDRKQATQEPRKKRDAQKEWCDKEKASLQPFADLSEMITGDRARLERAKAAAKAAAGPPPNGKDSQDDQDGVPPQVCHTSKGVFDDGGGNERSYAREETCEPLNTDTSVVGRAEDVQSLLAKEDEGTNAGSSPIAQTSLYRQAIEKLGGGLDKTGTNYQQTNTALQELTGSELKDLAPILQRLLILVFTSARWVWSVLKPLKDLMERLFKKVGELLGSSAPMSHVAEGAKSLAGRVAEGAKGMAKTLVDAAKDKATQHTWFVRTAGFGVGASLAYLNEEGANIASEVITNTITIVGPHLSAIVLPGAIHFIMIFVKIFAKLFWPDQASSMKDIGIQFASTGGSLVIGLGVTKVAGVIAVAAGIPLVGHLLPFVATTVLAPYLVKASQIYWDKLTSSRSELAVCKERLEKATLSVTLYALYNEIQYKDTDKSVSMLPPMEPNWKGVVDLLLGGLADAACRNFNELRSEVAGYATDGQFYNAAANQTPHVKGHLDRFDWFKNFLMNSPHGLDAVSGNWITQKKEYMSKLDRDARSDTRLEHAWSRRWYDAIGRSLVESLAFFEDPNCSTPLHRTSVVSAFFSEYARALAPPNISPVSSGEETRRTTSTGEYDAAGVIDSNILKITKLFADGGNGLGSSVKGRTIVPSELSWLHDDLVDSDYFRHRAVSQAICTLQTKGMDPLPFLVGEFRYKIQGGGDGSIPLLWNILTSHFPSEQELQMCAENIRTQKQNDLFLASAAAANKKRELISLSSSFLQYQEQKKGVSSFFPFASTLVDSLEEKWKAWGEAFTTPEAKIAAERDALVPLRKAIAATGGDSCETLIWMRFSRGVREWVEHRQREQAPRSESAWAKPIAKTPGAYLNWAFIKAGITTTSAKAQADVHTVAGDVSTAAGEVHDAWTSTANALGHASTAVQQIFDAASIFS